MPFSESLKLRVRKKSNWQCCICEAFYVEIHHIITQEDGGLDTEDNAAPLCPSCHDTYGSNPQKRKFIREKRDDWYAKCEKKYNINPLLEKISKRLDKTVTIEDLIGIEENLINKMKARQATKPEQTYHYSSKNVKNYIKQKKFNDAINSIKDNLAEYFFLLGYCYGEQNKISDMINSYDKSLSINKTYKLKIGTSKDYYWAVTFNKGVKYFTEANKVENKQQENDLFEKSINAFNDALLINPTDSDIYKNLAFVNMSSGKNEEAIEPLKKLVHLTNDLDGYKYLGEIYYAFGSNKKSSYGIDGNVEDSIDASAHFANAIDVLEKGIAIYPDDDDLTRVLNASYIEMGRVEEALKSSKTLVDKEPDNKTYRYNYGVILLQSEKYESAEEQFMKALEIDPDYENAIYNLAVTYVSWGTQMSKEAEENEDFSGEYKKKYEKALPYLESVVGVDPENAEIWELLGKVYSVLGMQDKALEAFGKSDQLTSIN
jgi:tetratricopeptide (TPR) repeat protein